MSSHGPASEPQEVGLPGGGPPGLPSELAARTLVDQLPAILYVADVGVEGRWHYVSRGVRAILGFAPEELLEDPNLWARQIHPDDRERVFERECELAEPAVPEEYRMRHRDGSIVWLRDEAALVVDANGRMRWHGVMSDITDRKLAETELERRAEQQAVVARLGKHALEGGAIDELMNESLAHATRTLGLQAGAVFEQAGDGDSLIVRAGLNLDVLSLGPASDRAAELASGIGQSGVIGRIEGRHGRWGVLWLAGAQERPFGAADVDFVQALANILADAIQRTASEEDIRYQALHDPLTGLPNRTLFLDRLEQSLASPEAQVAVVLLDLDNFKLVNDSLGHSTGDELLIEIAPRLRTAVRPGDTIARLGGDEFVVLLEGIPGQGVALRVAERIVSAFELPFQLSVGEHYAKASVGIAISDGQGSPADSLMRDADAAMYQAKERGRARFEIFDRAMRARTVARLSLENDLRRALERDQLEVVYQPIVTLADGSIASVEALLRWEHPDRGAISPAQFIPVAEDSGLIEPIGCWVLEAACAQATRWHEELPDSRPLGISVNVSLRQFTQRDLGKTVAKTLARTGLEPECLCLELTESVLMKEPEGVSQTIQRVADLGVRFALDDFGTGYSSLAYLTRLPIDGLKVDRSFVQALPNDRRSTAITTAIVRMAQALSLEVIAEGVEAARHVEALRDMHCELAQGFHFHPPLRAPAISQLLRPPGSPAAPSAPTGADERYVRQSPHVGSRR
ncbi:MAG TPA: EAL domain-containing protein [Solirubrobacteraceae bacterium]|nr:EAL domain-containing protein [Solirubrobacteraceae bacterium]